jgi:hypothetical protein
MGVAPCSNVSIGYDVLRLQAAGSTARHIAGMTDLGYRPVLMVFLNAKGDLHVTMPSGFEPLAVVGGLASAPLMRSQVAGGDWELWVGQQPAALPGPVRPVPYDGGTAATKVLDAQRAAGYEAKLLVFGTRDGRVRVLARSGVDPTTLARVVAMEVTGETVPLEVGN